MCGFYFELKFLKAISYTKRGFLCIDITQAPKHTYTSAHLVFRLIATTVKINYLLRENSPPFDQFSPLMFIKCWQGKYILGDREGGGEAEG